MPSCILVEYTHSDSLEEFDKEFTDLQKACIFAQSIEEDGGSASVTVTDPTSNTSDQVDHWHGYQIHLAVSSTGDSVGIVFPQSTTE